MTGLLFGIPVPAGGVRDLASFTEEERARLRPIAETLAMLDGNAFFTAIFEHDDRDYPWCDQYLPEAHALYVANGGWSSEFGKTRT